MSNEFSETMMKTNLNNDEVRSLYQNGFSDIQIAKQLHVGRAKLRAWRESNGIPSKKKVVQKLSLSELQKIVEGLNAGQTLTNISSELNMSRVTLAKMIKKAGLSYKEYRPAHPVEIDDYVLTQVQKEVLLGDMFGDGGLVPTSKKNAYYQCAHSIGQKSFLYWKANVFHPLTSRVGSYKTKDGEYVRMGTWTSGCLKAYHQDFYPDGKGNKTITVSLANRMTPLALAVWYMGDGSINRNTGVFHVGRQIEFYQVAEILSDKFEMLLKACRYEREWHLRVMNPEKFFTLISPYLLESFGYKVPKAYRELVGNQQPSILPIMEQTERIGENRFLSVSKENEGSETGGSLNSDKEHGNNTRLVKLSQGMRDIHSSLDEDTVHSTSLR